MTRYKMKKTKLKHFPIAFRKGGPDDKYGIWFSYIQGRQDFLLDPNALCSCLGPVEEDAISFFSPFINVEDDDSHILPIVSGNIDHEGHMMTWEIRDYTKDVTNSVSLDFDLYSVYTEIEDSIAALYNRFVIFGCETAYDDKLSLSDMGEIMMKMLSHVHSCCRETGASLVCSEDFDLKFRETDHKDCGGEENLLEVTVQIGHRHHNFTVNRNSFDFKRLRHDLENFMYHDEAHLQIWGNEDWDEIVINIVKHSVVDETIPLNAGTHNRYSPVLLVTVEQCCFDEKETKELGFCDIIPTLKSVYYTFSEIARFYARNNDKKELYDKDVWLEDFMSKEFLNYLLSEKKALHDNATFIRNNYAYSETEVMPKETNEEFGGAGEEENDKEEED